MRAIEFTEAQAKYVFGRGGGKGGTHKGKVTRKFRCASGPRKGRIVAKMSTCHAPVDAKKKARMTVTRARTPAKAAWHSKITKKSSGISQAVRRKNVAMAKGKRKR